MVVFTLATKPVNSPVIKSNDDILVLDNTIRLLLTMFNDLTLDPDNEGILKSGISSKLLESMVRMEHHGQ